MGGQDEGPVAHESDAFARLYRCHGEQILRYCFRRTGNWAEAEDIRSVVFYEAWRRRREVDLATQVALPWLYGVAKNIMRNHARSRRRHDAALRRLPRATVEPDEGQEVAERLDASDRARAVMALVNRLPESERDVVLLCILADQSYEATARTLHVPVGTVRSRLWRARRRLRRWSPASAETARR